MTLRKQHLVAKGWVLSLGSWLMAIAIFVFSSLKNILGDEKQNFITNEYIMWQKCVLSQIFHCYICTFVTVIFLSLIEQVYCNVYMEKKEEKR